MSFTDNFRDLEQLFEDLKSDIAILKDFALEDQYLMKGHRFGRLLRRAHVLSSDETIALVEDATDSGALTEAQAGEILLTDLIVRGKRREDGSDVYLIVEVSWGVGVHDVERAAKRARLLSQIGTPAIPVVAGEWISADA